MSYILKSTRLGFRMFNENDAESFYNSRNEDKFKHWFPGNECDDIEDALETMDDHNDCVKNKTLPYVLAVELLETNELIGIIEIYDSRDFEETQISWHFNSKHSKKGYASEAGAAITDYLFNELNLDSICATMDIGNIASYKTAEKSGFKRVSKLEYWRAQSGEVYYYKKQNINAASIRKSA